MLLSDFTFDEQGTAGWAVDRAHWVDIRKRIDINTEQVFFDVVLTTKTDFKGERIERIWFDLDPVQAQCVVYQLFEGNFDEALATQEG